MKVYSDKIYIYRLDARKFQNIFLNFLEQIYCDIFAYHVGNRVYEDEIFKVMADEDGDICTCGFDKKEYLFFKRKPNKEQIERFYEKNHHTEECQLMWPNFWYKPTNFKLQWYKHPLRDAYTNRPVSKEEFINILNECVKSYRR